MDFMLGVNILELILLALFWGALLTGGIWLLGVLFPAVKPSKNDHPNPIKR